MGDGSTRWTRLAFEVTYEIVDVSDNKPYVATLPNGVAGLIAKATEGDYHTDTLIARYIGQYQGHVPFAAYHYVTANDPASQAARVASVVPVSVPLALDVETAGAQSTVGPLYVALKARGYDVVLTYWPRWFWSQVGSPDLSGLPPLWASNYSSAAVGWEPYGGNTVAGLQFTDAYSINGVGYDMSSFNDISMLEGNDMLLTDVVGKRPDGTEFTVKDVLANQYLGTWYGGPSTPGGESFTAVLADIRSKVDAGFTVDPATVTSAVTAALANWPTDLVSQVATATANELDKRLAPPPAPAA